MGFIKSFFFVYFPYYFQFWHNSDRSILYRLQKLKILLVWIPTALADMENRILIIPQYLTFPLYVPRFSSLTEASTLLRSFLVSAGISFCSSRIFWISRFLSVMVWVFSLPFSSVVVNFHFLEPSLVLTGTAV